MSSDSLPQHSFHPRNWRTNRFVYPVLSRRAKGISIGVNLNPDKVCNFDCIYCQVDRRSESETRFVSLDELLVELREMLELAGSGGLFREPEFESVPEHLRRLNDIAFSGDGEPTTYRNFDEIIERVAELKGELGMSGVKMVLITNASMLHRGHVKRGLEILDANQGEIWAKLEAGTDAYYQLIERTTIPFSQILKNITDAARVRPVVLQSLFMRVAGEPPTREEISAYVDRVREIQEAGGKIDRVQVYTVARPPAEAYVTPLVREELEQIAEELRERTKVVAEVYPGTPD